MMWVIADWYIKIVGLGVVLFLVWSLLRNKIRYGKKK